MTANQRLNEKLAENDLDIEFIKSSLKAQEIETPSWGFANSGTGFKTFAWPGAAVTTRQKIDDAAMVNRMTGIAPSMAIHIPWDLPKDGDFDALRQYAESSGIHIGAVNPNLFQNEAYKLGSLANPDSSVQEIAREHILECCEIMLEVNSKILSLWFADGTNYAGQDNLRARKRRLEENLGIIYNRLPPETRMLLEYKFFEPAFYSTDIPDWGTSYALCSKLGPQAQVLVDLGHHPHGTNIEQIVAFLLDEGHLGGFHFNNRRYGDDDLIVGSVNPFELFLIYNELVDAALQDTEPSHSTALNVAYMIDQAHNIEGKLAPMIHSVLNCQEAYAKALMVPRKQLEAVQQSGDVLTAHRLLVQAYNTDVQPLLEQVREELGVPINPIEAYMNSGYEQNIRDERGVSPASGGYQ